MDVFAFYSYKLLRTVAFIISHTFIPIFLFSELGYSIFQVSLFTTIVHAILLPFIPLTGKVIKKIGVKRTISLHIFGMALFFYLLKFLSGNFVNDLPFILLLGLIKSVPKSFFSVSETIFVSKKILGTKEDDGKNLSYIQITLIVASILAPFVGGVITYFFGFVSFFTAVSILSLISAIPLWLGADVYIRSEGKYFDFIGFVINKMNRNVQLAEFGKNFSDSILQVLWPIFIILVVENTLNLGSLLSVSALIAIVVSKNIGKELDKGNQKNILTRTTKLASIIFFFRTLFPIPLALLITDSINKIITPLIKIPYDKNLFSYIKSFENKVFGSTVYVLYSEFMYLVGFGGIATYFGILELFKITPNYFVFLPIFMLYGSSIVLMQNIQYVASK